MPRDGSKTREKILDATQALVIRQGFAATSVDDIQEAADISRGTFFYHFPSKADLARELIRRYAAVDRAMIDGFMARAERLASDPLQQALIFLALHEELFREVSPAEAGCLFASFSYEAGAIDADTHRVVTDSVLHWRRTLGGKLRRALERHEPVTVPVDPDRLADAAYSVLQGAFILRRSMDDPGLMAAHMREYRRYLELLFGVAGPGEALEGSEAA